MHDRKAVDALFKELERSLLRDGPDGPILGAGWSCRLYWAACETAEAARIFEAHRRRDGLTPEGHEALERYERIYESAELALLAHFPYAHAHRSPNGADR